MVLGVQFLGGGDTPDFGRAFSNYNHFRACGRLWLCSVQGARGTADEKRQKIEDRRRIAVKPKSADDYVGRPDNSSLTSCESVLVKHYRDIEFLL